MIDTGPLPADRAKLVEDFVSALVDSNPGMTGIILHGSYWNLECQYPNADIDLNWTGEAADGPGGDMLRQRNHIRNGVHFEVFNYFWGDYRKPETLSLAAAVSLARCHILWERKGELSDPRSDVRRLLKNAEWVDTKIGHCIDAVRHFRDEWLDLDKCREPIAGDWDFIRKISLHIGGFFSALMLQPPSAARKGYAGILQLAEALALPKLADLSLRAAGMDTFTEAEINAWHERLVRLTDAPIGDNELDAIKFRYYLTGSDELIRRGHAPAALWPLWRSARLAALRFGGEAQTCFDEFGARLQVVEAEDLLEKAKRLSPLIHVLDHEKPRLLKHLLNQATEL